MTNDYDGARKAGGSPNMEGLRSVMNERQKTQHDARVGRKPTVKADANYKTPPAPGKTMFNATKVPMYSKTKYEPDATLVNQNKGQRLNFRGKRARGF